MQGFEAYGVDINKHDIGVAKARYHTIADNLLVIEAKPAASDAWFGKDFAVVTAIQSLYYLSDQDMAVRLESLHASMAPGAVFFATTLSPEHMFFEHSEPAEDGMRRVRYRDSRIEYDYYVNFTRDEDHLRARFAMFEPKHIGFYSERFRSDEGRGFHFTFVGVRR